MKEENRTGGHAGRTLTINNNFMFSSDRTASLDFNHGCSDSEKGVPLYRPTLRSLLGLLVSVMKPVQIFLYRFAADESNKLPAVTEILLLLEAREMRSVEYMAGLFRLPELKPDDVVATFRSANDARAVDENISLYALLHCRKQFLIYQRDELPLVEMGQDDIYRHAGFLKAHFISDHSVCACSLDEAKAEIKKGRLQSGTCLLLGAIELLYRSVIEVFEHPLKKDIPLVELCQRATSYLPHLMELDLGVASLEQIDIGMMPVDIADPQYRDKVCEITENVKIACAAVRSAMLSKLDLLSSAAEA